MEKTGIISKLDSSMILRQTSLSANIIQFCRFLRQKGFTVGVDDEAITLKALQFIDYTSSFSFPTGIKGNALQKQNTGRRI